MLYKEEAEQDKGADDIVMTEYDYILLMLETEKADRKPFEKWGYEFSINENESVSIRGLLGKRITIQVDVANKITLVYYILKVSPVGLTFLFEFVLFYPYNLS